ncbi:TolC family protein [Vibrio sp. JC009]|uniref:TolC family protein n=1 Tax=Vibrio sp. JC009 TaxID=2912314 RepID=UPI0023B13B4B|nr:TolC family protein [Vibrio sp. JC009]WED22976.1 TolC family protein [Vibrio sp. JC009]
MKTKLNPSIALILCTGSLAGCSTMRSDFVQPELAIPQSWSQSLQEVSQQVASNSVEQPDKWWSLFEDPQLDALIEQVLQSNSDLAKATLTLKKARLEAGLSENNKVPELSFSHASSYEYDIDDDSSDTSFSSSLSLSYELDLWGRVDAAADASDWNARASYEDRESTAQSLAVTAATLYWKLGYLNQMISLTEENIAGTEKVAMLTRRKFDNGSATRLEVLESTQTLYGQQVQLSQLQQELSETQNSISMLLNQPLQETDLIIEQLSVLPVPEIAPGIPSELLLRRPDIKASLYTLKSSLATKDRVEAGYMPTLTLTGSLSTSSSGLLELLENPVAKLGSGIVLPFLEWKEMELNKNISELDYQMAVLDYRDTVYEALEEVANLLTAKQHYHYKGGIYKDQYSNAQEIEAIYSSRYKYGASDMIDWIKAMESRRSIESSFLENRYNQFVIQAKLYQSLGGGDIVPGT